MNSAFALFLLRANEIYDPRGGHNYDRLSAYAAVAIRLNKTVKDNELLCFYVSTFARIDAREFLIRLT